MIKSIRHTEDGNLEGTVWNELFQEEMIVSISSEAKLPYANRCAAYFNAMPDEVIDRLCQYCTRYCEEMRSLLCEEDIDVPKGISGREILSYIAPNVLIVEEKCDESIIEFHVECGCDWEIEHGLEITVKDNKLLYIGPFEDMAPFNKGRLEYAGYFNESTDLNMNYADRE